MSNAPEGSVIITPGEVYAKVVALTDAVTKMVAADTNDAEARKDLKDRVTKVEAEIASIKQRLWFIAGVAAAAGGGIGSTVAPLLVR